MLRIEARNSQTPIERKPPWIKTRLRTGPQYTELRQLVRREGLHTVCEEAGCPNIFECWEDREATFLIGGDQCTRRCDFCQIDTGKPADFDAGDPPRLVGVEVGGLAGVDLAEVAASGALVAADQEGGLAVFPALEDVGAAGLFAHRVQAARTDDALELVVLGSHRRAGPDPLGLALDRGLRVAGLDAQHPSALRCDRHAFSFKMCGCQRTPERVAARTSWSADSRCAQVSASTSAMVTRRPSSLRSDVTSASGMPHGTMRPNWSRSESQFSAKPCIVTPLATRTPIAATLRSRRTSSAGNHTPLRPATRIAPRPRSAHRSMIVCSSART